MPLWQTSLLFGHRLRWVGPRHWLSLWLSRETFEVLRVAIVRTNALEQSFTSRGRQHHSLAHGLYGPYLELPRSWSGSDGLRARSHTHSHKQSSRSPGRLCVDEIVLLRRLGARWFAARRLGGPRGMRTEARSAAGRNPETHEAR